MHYQIKNQEILFSISSLPFTTVQEFLDAYLPSRKEQHLLFQEKRIFLDASSAKRESLLKGKYLRFLFTSSLVEISSKKEIPILYEDEFCVIAYKEKGLLVHADGQEKETLTEQISKQYGQKLQAIHRLDKETSGLLFFSRIPLFQSLWDKLLSEKKIQRDYLAIVEGKLPLGKSFLVDKPIGRDRHHAQKMRIHPQGKEAQTKFTCIQSVGENSLLSCHLYTGRTHQIRVHLASVQHPIVGDELYGKKDKRGLALFAHSLRFWHPFREKEIMVSCPIKGEYASLFSENHQSK